MRTIIKTSTARTYNPEREMLVASIDDALYDLRHLRLAGVIRGMEVIDEWPKLNGKNWNILGRYCCISDAEQLVSFFKDGWLGRLMAVIDAKFDGDGAIKLI